LNPEARADFLSRNYERIFDRARRNVRAWEAAHIKPARAMAKQSPSSGDREVW
jgi:hypothetical protein